MHIDRERKKKKWEEFMKGTLKIPLNFQITFNLDSVVLGSKT